MKIKIALWIIRMLTTKERLQIMSNFCEICGEWSRIGCRCDCWEERKKTEPKSYNESLCQAMQELSKAVEEFKKEMRKTSLGRFILKLIEIKVCVDIYLMNLKNKIICITKGHHPIWYDIGTDISHKHCLRCKKSWYRYRDGN